MPTKRLSMQVCVLLAVTAISILCPPEAVTQANDPLVEMQTTKGTIVIRVFAGLVPRTASNFLDLVSRGFYDGKTFHRIESWCIQGGDPNGNGSGRFIDPQTGQPRFIPLEIDRRLSHNGPGVVAMARSSNPHSASCQFYITKKRTSFLDGKYAIFGKVINGINSIYQIRRGDAIVSARILPKRGSGESSYTRRPVHRGPVQKYTPPTDIPDSGF